VAKFDEYGDMPRLLAVYRAFLATFLAIPSIDYSAAMIIIARPRVSLAGNMRPMRKRPSQIGEWVKRLAAILILLWWGGLNCLTGCLTASPVVIKEGHCSMEGEGDCCLSQADEGKPSPTSIVDPSSSILPLNCCSLESLTAEVTHDARAACNTGLITAVLSRTEFTPEAGPRAEMPERLARLPDRGDTRLLCCIFLI
jgi:hypothetical protein